jgi:hypothetical protein
MNTKEFANPWQARDYIVGVISDVLDYIYSNQKEIEKRMEEEGIETVAELAIEDLQTTIVYNGKQLSLNDGDGVCWLAGCGLEWLYGCFEYDEDNCDAQNSDGWYVSDTARWYADGYFAALTKN